MGSEPEMPTEHVDYVSLRRIAQLTRLDAIQKEAEMDEVLKAPTEEMIEAGVNAFNLTETLSVRRLLEVAYPAMRAVEQAGTPAPSSLPDVWRRFCEIIDKTDDEGFTPEIEQELMDLRALATDGSEDER